jgi:hypothetical protein
VITLGCFDQGIKFATEIKMDAGWLITTYESISGSVEI